MSEFNTMHNFSSHHFLRFLSRRSLPGLLFALACAPAFAQSADQKIGFVNTNEILQKSPQAQAVTKRLRSEFEGRENLIQDCQKKFRDLDATLRREGRSMEESKREKMVSQARSKKRECEELENRFREDLNRRRSEEVNNFQKEVIETVERLAKRKGLSVVLQPTAVIYVDNNVDLTDQVLDALAKEYER